MLMTFSFFLYIVRLKLSLVLFLLNQFRPEMTSDQMKIEDSGFITHRSKGVSCLGELQ